MLPAPAGHRNNQVGFVILSFATDDLKTLAVEWVIGVFYCDGLLRTVGIMRLFPGGDGQEIGRLYPERYCSFVAAAG
jgi:hypothetical protein